MNILLLDIETAPKLAYVWRFFKENVGANQVVEHGHIMSFAVKWLGGDEIEYFENRSDDDTAILKELWNYFDAADIVIAHNGERFDFPQVMSRLVVHGYKPPSPFKMVDTCKSARREFGFASNSLEYLANVLGCTPKDKHKKFAGFELWLECIRGNDEAWEEMKHYNIQDVQVLEEIYLKMRPYIRNHPNVANIEEAGEPLCPKCASGDLQWRGFAYTQVGKFHRFQCQSCGGWGRTRYTEKTLEERKSLLTNVNN